MKKTRLLAFAVLTAGAFLNSAGALTLDLTGLNSSGSINGAIYTQFSGVASSGTGLINSFERVQGNGISEGFNASVRPVMANVNTDPNFTRDIRLGEVPIVGNYYQFLFDSNQTNANPLISIDALRIFTRDSVLGTLTAAAQLTDLTGALGIAQRYTMDILGGENNSVTLNTLSPGSGRGDMFLYVPVSFFQGDLPTDFVYLYTRFGENLPGNDGFEEWSVLQPQTAGVSDGGNTLILLGLSLGAIALGGRKFAA